MLYAKNWGLSPPRYGQHISHSHSLVAFSCASHAHIKESLSAVSLGKPLTFGGFAMRQAHV
ncbi:TPA: hypothetical protein LTB03_001786 [Escherichia coli]|nr:hypothetical protein [Escherichia coli]